MDRAHESLARGKDTKSLRDLLRLARSDLQGRTRQLFVNHLKSSEAILPNYICSAFTARSSAKEGFNGY